MSAAAGGFRSRSRSGESPRLADKAGNQTGKKTDARGAKSQQHDKRRPHSYKQQKRQKRTHRETAGVDKPRLLAFAVLNRVSDDDAYANLILPKCLREERVKGRDAAFATEITYGCLRSLGVLDTVIDACSSRELDSLATPVLNALRLGTYQLLFTRVDDHAAGILQYG